MLKNFTNEQILQGLRERNPQIETYLLKDLGPTIIGLVIKRGGSKELAKEVFQESMLAFFEMLLLRPSTEKLNVQGYVVGIAKNKLNKHFEKTKKVHTLTVSPPLESLMNVVEEKYALTYSEYEKLKMIYACMDSLDTECDELLTRYFMGDEKLKEMAEDMQLSPKYIRVKKYRCMKTLLGCVDKMIG